MMRITEETFAAIFELPVGCELTLKHVTEQQAVKVYGPGGNGNRPRLDKGPGVYTWICQISQTVICDRGHTHGMRFFEGHGLTAGDAIERAAAEMTTILEAYGQATGEAL